MRMSYVKSKLISYQHLERTVWHEYMTVSYPKVDRNPETFPSAKREMQSPKWRKLVVPMISPILQASLYLQGLITLESALGLKANHGNCRRFLRPLPTPYHSKILK